MKKNIWILLSFLLITSLFSCKYNKVDAPELGTLGADLSDVKATMTIKEVKDYYTANKNSYPTTGVKLKKDAIIKATVISEDKEGNLYKSCFIEDETGGIELKCGMSNISALYPQGSTVLLYAKDLVIAKYYDDMSIGYPSVNKSYEASYIPERLIPAVLKFVSRGAVKPKVCRYADLNKALVGSLVTVEGVQFKESYFEKDGDNDYTTSTTYADPEHKNDKSRNKISLDLVTKDGKVVVVRTSSYAKFSGDKLASGLGSVTGILHYFQDSPQLVVLKRRDIKLNAPRF